MDSLTQATLGAAVGHICWQGKLGRKALITGALLATLPDLDVLIYPFLDGVQRLYWHRGESHSVWFMLLGSIGIGWLLTRLSFTKQLTLYKAVIGAFLIFSTHILIDLFTVYGTQLLAPFSRHGFSLYNMYIVDPVFTAPLLIGTIGAYLAKQQKIGLRLNQIGLLLASLYVVWSYAAQSIADQKFRQALAEQNITVNRQITSAGAFTTLLWRHIAETSDGFLLGYWSWLDENDKEIRFQFIPKDAAIVEQVKSTRTFEAVDWFSKGWWFVASSDNKTARVVDLRFSEIPPTAGQPFAQWEWPFAWDFHLAAQDEIRLKVVLPDLHDPVTALKYLGQRILGQESWVAGQAVAHELR